MIYYIYCLYDNPILFRRYLPQLSPHRFDFQKLHARLNRNEMEGVFGTRVKSWQPGKPSQFQFPSSFLWPNVGSRQATASYTQFIESRFDRPQLTAKIVKQACMLNKVAYCRSRTVCPFFTYHLPLAFVSPIRFPRTAFLNQE